MEVNYPIVTELCRNISHGCFGLFQNPAIVPNMLDRIVTHSVSTGWSLNLDIGSNVFFMKD